MKRFKEKYQEEIKKLTMFIPVVSRVHGPHHNEFYEVVKLFNSISAKISDDNYELKNDFSNLRAVTNNYVIPKDTCESYEYVYVTLKDLDKLYSDKK